MTSLDSDSDSNIQQKIEDLITLNIDHLNSLQEKIKKSEFSEDQLSEAYDICLNSFNSIDAFLKNQSGTRKKQKKSSSSNKTRKSDSQKKQSFKDDEDAVLKSDSSDSNKSDQDQNNKDSIPLKKQSSTPKTKKKSGSASTAQKKKKNKYFDSQDLFLQENNK